MASLTPSQVIQQFAIPTAYNLGTAAAGVINQLTPSQHTDFVVSETSTGGIVIRFTGFETPHSLEPMGGVQRHVVHEFPGGTKTLQTLGAFPENLKWTGILMGDNQGQTPIQRALQMDRLRWNGNVVTVQFDQLQWQGVVTKWNATIKNQNYLEYTCEIEAISDNSQDLPTSTATTTQSSLFSTIYSKLQTAFASVGINLPSATSAAITSWFSTIDAALFPAAGVLTAIAPTDASAIATAGAAISGLLAVSGNSTNLTTASSAQALLAGVKAITTLITPATTTKQVVQTVNPQYPALAAAYLGDATQWPAVAAANGTSDAQATGIKATVIPNANA